MIESKNISPFSLGESYQGYPIKNLTKNRQGASAKQSKRISFISRDDMLTYESENRSRKNIAHI